MIKIEEVLSLKSSEIDSKAGVVRNWGDLSPDALALILEAKRYEIEGSEYVFPDRFGMLISCERFFEIRDEINEEAGLIGLNKHGSQAVQ